MYYNYLKTSLRNLFRHKFFSALNVFGLAIAMSICMVLIMLVADQMNYDRYNTNADRIYRVTTVHVDENGNRMVGNQLNSASCLPLASELNTNYTGIEQAVRFRKGFGNKWIKFEDQNINIPITGYFADANVLEFFQYELQYGDAKTALTDPYSVVLTADAAKKHFQEENPLGETLDMGDIGIYTVTGILKKTSHKTHIAFEGLGSMSSVLSLEEEGKLSKLSQDWSHHWEGWTYVMAEEGKSLADIQEQLDMVYEANIGSNNTPGFIKMMFGLQPLLNITPGDIMNNSIGPQLPWVFVYFLSGLAMVILVTSCFNFTNLSIARSLTRAREIGVRKVTGAARWQIFIQFISESTVVALAALLLAVLLLVVLKPMILQLNFAQLLHWDLYNGFEVYIVFVVFAMMVGVLAGLFPAVILSAFQPVTVLKNLNNLKVLSRMGLRKFLLISQFSLSLIFILTVIVIYNQLDLFTHQQHGFNKKNNILLKLNNSSYQALKTELEKYNNITSVSAASHVPAAGTIYGAGIKKAKSEPESIDAGFFMVDEDYNNNMELKLIAGQFFTSEMGKSMKNFAIVNEAAISELNFESPQDAIGQEFYFMNDSSTKVIAGVVGNYNHRDLTREISPLVLLYDPVSFNVLQIAYTGSYDDAGKSIEKAWATINPGLKVDYRQIESEINKHYELVFGDLVNVLGFVSFLAIIISCLGLLGMATYATETRIKEISIRKVLGSENIELIILLSKGFAVMLAIAIAIGLPLAYLINDYWLSYIAYRTSIGFGTIGTSIMVLILFSIVTIGSQTMRSMFVNPVDNLKNE